MKNRLTRNIKFIVSATGIIFGGALMAMTNRNTWLEAVSDSDYAAATRK